MKITLTGEPKSMGTIYKYHCRFGFPSGYMSASGKSVKEQYQWEVKSQYKGELLTGDVKLEIKYYLGNKKKRDLDNLNKLVLDSMTGIVYEDDSQIVELHLYKKYDKGNPGIDIKII